VFGDIGGMISEIAWDNVRNVNLYIFDQWNLHGGLLIGVEPFRAYLLKSSISRFRRIDTRKALHEKLRRWAVVAKAELLFQPNYFRDHPEPTHYYPRTDGIFGETYWLLIESYWDLYCLCTFRATIGELVVTASSYLPDYKKLQKKSLHNRRTLRDIRRLLSLSNVFLLSNWLDSITERAIAAGDKAYFQMLGNTMKRDITAFPTLKARQWTNIVLLWHLGGSDMAPRREFLHLLVQNGYLPHEAKIDEESFRSQLASLGLAST